MYHFFNGRSIEERTVLVDVYSPQLDTLQGSHISDLFNENGEDRQQSNQRLTRRARSTGEQPVKKFDRGDIVWQEYAANPTAQSHAEELIFTACHYRLRYAFDYTVQFDIDEFWTPALTTEEKTLPEFLDVHMSKDAASIGFKQVEYPLDNSHNSLTNGISIRSIGYRLQLT